MLVSDTGELTWNTELPEAAYWTVNTPNTKLFTGFPEGRTIELGGVTLAIGKTRLDWATVSLVSRHATGFGESGKASEHSAGSDRPCREQGDDHRAGERRKKSRCTTTGEPAPSASKASRPRSRCRQPPAKTRCFALDPSGNRKQSVPVETGEAGASRIVLKPELRNRLV